MLPRALARASRLRVTAACSAALLVGARVAAAQDVAAERQDLRPHILFVFADDLRADALGAAGNPAIRTPRLDALAASGASFRRAYCLGGPHGAICVPSRAMLHTGRAYFGLDERDFDGARTLGEALGAAGYTTFATGKWHNGDRAFVRSFQSARSVLFSGMSDHFNLPVRDLVDGELGRERRETTHSSELFADAAVEFLSGHEGSSPFFCYLAFTAPHDPRDAPAPWSLRQGADLPPLPPNFAPQQPWDIGMMTVRDEMLAPWPRPEAVVRQQLGEYYALIEHMDHELGRVLDALAAREDGRPTLVVFAADNGLALGSHGLLGKQSVFEHSLRVPLIIAGPGAPPGASLNGLVYLADLYPTLLGAALVPPDTTPEATPGPGARLGRSLWPLLRGERDAVRDSLFLAVGTTQRAVTDGRYKLILYPEIARARLFDLASDPFERFDLVGRPEHAARVEALTARLAAWQQELGDGAPLSVAAPREAAIDLTGAARTPDRWQPSWIRVKYFGE